MSQPRVRACGVRQSRPRHDRLLLRDHALRAPWRRRALSLLGRARRQWVCGGGQRSLALPLPRPAFDSLHGLRYSGQRKEVRQSGDDERLEQWLSI